MASRRLFTIGSPRPVPSTERFRFRSNRSNFVNNFPRSSSRIPMPVSATSMNSFWIVSWLSPVIRRLIHPFSVYFTAFVRRFIMICLIRTSSPCRYSCIYGETDMLNWRFFSITRFWIDRSTSSIRLLRLYLSIMISTFPDSIFDRSRISLMIVSNVLPEFFIYIAYSLIWGCLLSRKTSSFIPSIAFKGVRISWDIFARNADSLFAASSASCAFCFNWIRSLLFQAITTNSIKLPSKIIIISVIQSSISLPPDASCIWSDNRAYR